MCVKEEVSLAVGNVVFCKIWDPRHCTKCSLIIIPVKYFVHKNKYLKTQPNFNMFYKEFGHYLSAEKKTAVKLLIYLFYCLFTI